MTGPARAILPALLLGLTTGCAREAAIENGPTARVGEGAGPDTVSGTVRLVGNAPFSRVVVEGDDTLAVTGPYEAEVRRLAGAEVRLTGERAETEGGPGPALRADSYTILGVDGERPAVGILRRDAEGHWLETPGGDRVRLRAVTARFGSMEGGRVWVVLGEDAAVLRYGLLRPAEEMDAVGR